ncbi:FERM RhoGEF and pleckstrin domain-containing protein 1, partial [Biomphalaria glabrata]
STSGRISSRSTSVTPKISSKPGMHSSSADLHTSSGSRSSGSHILDSNHTPGSGILRDSSGTPHSAMRVESVDVHSDSSMSGSRSLNSPRLEHGLSIDQDVIEAVNARTEGAMTDDEDDDEDLKSGSCVTPGISHVSSETKGAHSLLSPELNSPVRYVGLYSEVGSPECIQGDEVMSPEVDIVDKVVAPEVDIVDKVVAPVDTSKQVLASPAEVVGVAFTTDEGNAKMNISDDSVYSGDSPGHVSHTTSRPHLDLKLTNITSNLSSSVNVIHNLPESSSPLPTSSTPVPPSTHHDTASSSITTSATRTDTISSSPGTLPVSTSLSASQNVSSKPIRILKSKFIEDLGSRHPNTHVVDRKSDSGSKKVSSSIVGHQTETKLDDLSPPFPSPPPPLSSQYMEDHGKRALDASPSSCVTDTALSRQDSKVRLTSRVPSLDSNRSSPVTEKVSSFPLSTESKKKKKTPLDMTSESPGDKVESEKTVKQRAPKQGNEEGSSKPKEVPHKKFPNGDVVGAGAPVKEHLEAEQGPNRKLSAGTDLIEDIPYILHRRLEGHKEETAVFKVSEADKLKRQRSLSPASKPASLTCVPSSESSERSRLTPDTRCLSPEVGEGHRGKPHSDKSPTLNRRIEFVNVHKLPSRNSYSSVDDTTSPSVEQDLLKQLEHGALSPEATKFSSPEKKWKPQGTLNQKTEDHSDAASNKNYTKENMIGGTKETTEASITVIETLDSTERTTKSKIDDTKALCYQDNVECSQSAQTSNVKEEVLVKKSINNETVSDEVQFYSPKIPGSQRLKNVITTSVSDDFPDTVVPEGEHILHETMKKPDQSFHLQFFEVSKPQPNLGRGTTESPIATKEVPKSLSLKSKQTDASDTSSVKPPSPTLPTEGQDSSSREITGEASLENKSVVKPKHRAPSLSATGRNSTSSTSSSDNNQFLIDLPSPAAALFYSDSDSPPPSQSRANSGLSPLTFSTFRPDPAEDTLLKVEEISKDKPKTNRWSLQSVEEAEEATDYKVIMSEGVVEKSALKKRTEDSDKPKEPKRVSWHEDSELQHSYHSDVSMTAQRSPVEECDTALFGEGAALVDSGDILETLEHLRQQNSESDMTNSGSSMTSTDGSDEETQSNAKQVYMQYAAAKGISPSKTGVGECRRREVSPLETLEGLGSLDGSFSSRKYNAEEDYYKTKDSSPLEQLERLSGLRVDNFDDEGEADDEDDEPNFPPPPPILDIPDEMMVSYEGDLPLPAPDIPPTAETEFKKSLVKSWQAKTNLDPMSSSDPVGDLSCTESESDFDSEVANEKLKKLSPSITEPEYSGRIPGEMKKSAFIECRSKPSSQLKAPPPEVLPKPLDMQPAPHLVQKAQPQKQAPPPVMPKPKPPPSILQHRPAPIRQPQMGKGKHFDRSRHMSSSSSTSSSSEPHQPPPPSAPS